MKLLKGVSPTETINILKRLNDKQVFDFIVGKTPYLHTAYAFSADGTEGFTTVYPNLNLLEGSKNFSGDWGNVGEWTNDGTYKGLTVKKRTYLWQGIFKTFTAPKDGKYTFSAYVKSSGNNTAISRFVHINGEYNSSLSGHIGSVFDWFRDSFTATLKAKDTITARYEIAGSGTDSTLWTAGHKWEEGSVATPWMPSESEVSTADYPSFIGHYSNYTQVDSPNPREYTWSFIRGNDGKEVPKGPDGKIQKFLDELNQLEKYTFSVYSDDLWEYEPQAKTEEFITYLSYTYKDRWRNIYENDLQFLGSTISITKHSKNLGNNNFIKTNDGIDVTVNGETKSETHKNVSANSLNINAIKSFFTIVLDDIKKEILIYKGE